MKHGSEVTYGHGCRCDACRSAASAYARNRRAVRRALIEANLSLVEHGKSGTYCNWSCRCEACTAAHRVERLRLMHAAKRAAS